MEETKFRNIHLYKEYFTDFYYEQKQKVKDKILWTFKVVETLQQVPTDYLKHIEGTDTDYMKYESKLVTTYFGYFAFLTKVNLLFLQMDFRKKCRKRPKEKLKRHLK